MPRPLMQHGIAKLEELFETWKTDEAKLKTLAAELEHRHVPRAVALLAKVRQELKGAKDAAPPAGATRVEQPQSAVRQDTQPSLFAEDFTLIAEPAQPEVRRQTLRQPEREARVPVTPAPVLSRVPVAPTTANPPPAPVGSEILRDAPPMMVEEAYKALKATVGSTWEVIEQSRRQIVQRSHPERVAALSIDQRAQAESEARRANAAYAVLLKFRMADGRG